MADKPNKYEGDKARIESNLNYDSAIKALGAQQTDYRNRHITELQGEQQDDFLQQNARGNIGAGISINLFSRGEKMNYTAGFADLVNEELALKKLQSSNVDFKDIKAAKKLDPNLTYTKMAENFKSSGSVDGHDYFSREQAKFEKAAGQILDKHPKAEILADSRDMLIDGKMNENGKKPKPEVTAHDYGNLKPPHVAKHKPEEKKKEEPKKAETEDKKKEITPPAPVAPLPAQKPNELKIPPAAPGRGGIPFT